MGIYIGIDTSNYKTSVAAVSENGDILFSRSEYLEVAHGERGLRQSEVFFRQSNLLPSFLGELFSNISNRTVDGIGVSSRPRRVEGSYMPCFLAGLNAAREIGSALNVPVAEFSHQEGHAAAIIENGNKSPERCLLFHLSGGTTEFLLCEPDKKGYHTEIVGGTKDISIGQLLDRVGVAMGFDFPSGMYLDEIASRSGNASPFKTRIMLKDGYFNLSGLETKITRSVSARPEESELNSTVTGLMDSISGLLTEAAVFLADKYEIRKVYMAGGVASSKTVRKYMHGDPLIIFGPAELSGDNAVGTALLARRTCKN